MKLCRLGATAAILATAAVLLTMVLVPAASAGRATNTIWFGDSTYVGMEGSTIEIEVYRSTFSGPATVYVSTTRGTATATTDYTPLQQEVSLSEGSTYEYVYLEFPVDGVPDETNETVKLALSSPSAGYRLARPKTTTVTIHEMPAPPAPGFVAATAANPVVLNWAVDPYPSSDLTFTVTRCSDPPTAPDRSCRDITDGGTTATTFTDWSVIAGGTYYYTVFVHNTDGASSPSNEVSVTVPSGPQWITSIVAAPFTEPASHIFVQWTVSSDLPAENDYEFRVFRGLTPTKLTYFGSTYWPSTSLIDGYVTTNTTYYYRVVAKATDGTSSAPSAVASATAP